MIKAVIGDAPQEINEAPFNIEPTDLKVKKDETEKQQWERRYS